MDKGSCDVKQIGRYNENSGTLLIKTPERVPKWDREKRRKESG
jgi:hypothetical protein